MERIKEALKQVPPWGWALLGGGILVYFVWRGRQASTAGAVPTLVAGTPAVGTTPTVIDPITPVPDPNPTPSPNPTPPPAPVPDPNPTPDPVPPTAPSPQYYTLAQLDSILPTIQQTYNAAINTGDQAIMDQTLQDIQNAINPGQVWTVTSHPTVSPGAVSAAQATPIMAQFGSAQPPTANAAHATNSALQGLLYR